MIVLIYNVVKYVVDDIVNDFIVNVGVIIKVEVILEFDVVDEIEAKV